MASCCSPQLRFNSTAIWFPSPTHLAAVKSEKHCDFGRRNRKLCTRKKQSINGASGHEQEEGEGEFRVVTALESRYNRIVIVDTPISRLLLLDSTNNVHSIVNKGGSKWTGSYWDEFVALPAVVPEGPIAIFGLGAGTAAHLMLDLWTSLLLEGWEIDEILIDLSREYMGLGDLEKHTMEGGFLNIRIGDVFSPDAALTGPYAGIIVDLFAEGKVLPELEQAGTWLNLYDKLMPNGRFMVNCGAGQNRLCAEHEVGHKALPMRGSWKLNPTIRALCKAFPGQVNWKKMPPSAGENYLALTGSLPDMTTWSAALPVQLKTSVNQWRFCYIHDD